MPFVLLHGLGGDRSQVLSLVAPALPAGARICAPDLRAHGASPVIGAPHDFSFSALTIDLTERIRAEDLGDEPLTVIGISLGAALGLQLALLQTLPVHCLVFLRPAFTDQPLPPHLTVFPVIAELLHRHGAEDAERLFRNTGLYRSILRESELGAAGVLEQFRAPDARARAPRLMELPRNRAFSSGVTLTLPPTTIIAAPRDPLHPTSVAELWHRSIAGSSMVTLPARDDGLAAHVAAARSAIRVALH